MTTPVMISGANFLAVFIVFLVIALLFFCTTVFFFLQNRKLKESHVPYARSGTATDREMVDYNSAATAKGNGKADDA